ncbi:MAG: peptidase family protein [Bacilli bacterium]|nr:peptidase family protein [Bacilli bacterium]
MATLRNQTAFNKLANWMSQQDVQISLITSPVQIYYLTGFWCEPHERLIALVVEQTADPWLLVPVLEADKAAAFGLRLVHYQDSESPIARMCEQFQHIAQLRSVAIEKEIVTVFRFEALQQELHADQTVPVKFLALDQFLAEVRAVKSADEVAKMKHACQLTDQILEKFCSYFRIGMTERHLVKWIEERAFAFGATGMSFSTMVLSGESSSLPHGVPSDRPTCAGQFLLLDFGIIYEGYCSDITRTFVVGSANDEQKKLYEAVRLANETALQTIRPGVAASEVDRAARSILEAAGYGPYFTHRLGHGLGIDIHEFPSIHAQNPFVLVPGVTFTVEPGAYVPEVGGVRIEDDVVVTDDGVLTLTSFPKSLIELPG